MKFSISKKSKEQYLQDSTNTYYSGTEELEQSENALESYNRFIVKTFISFIEKEKYSRDNVLEFGAGTGTLAAIFRDKFGISPICIELAPELREKLVSRGFVCFSDMNKYDRLTSFIYTSNVLEHIEDDSGAIAELFEKLEPGGGLGIYVPALPMLFSDLDRKVGHFRRYKKIELLKKVKDAGFQVELCNYNDSLGVLASTLLKLVGFKNKVGLGSTTSLLIYDKIVFPISRFLDLLGFRYIIGKNLILFARKPN